MFFSCGAPLRRQVLTPVIITSKHPHVGTRHGVSANHPQGSRDASQFVSQTTVPLTGGRARSAEGV